MGVNANGGGFVARSFFGRHNWRGPLSRDVVMSGMVLF